MKRMISGLSVVLMAAMILSACVIAPATETATPTVQAPTPTPAPGEQTVTLADNGMTLSLKVGESFLLKLGSGFTWQISLSNPDVISLRRGVMVIMGAQGIYDAIAPGTVVLSATGDPLCRQSTPPCMAPSILFSITIEVSA